MFITKSSIAERSQACNLGRSECGTIIVYLIVNAMNCFRGLNHTWISQSAGIEDDKNAKEHGNCWICGRFPFDRIAPMKRAGVRFYAQLNDFLPPERRTRTITCTFDVSGSVKDMIESLGVPHTEVDLILVDGQAVDFTYRVQEGDRISVYPEFQSIDISPHAHLRPQPLPEIRFVADTHLGRLAAYLRMLGFDTLYRNDYADEELATLSADENRILLTRDRGLLMRAVVTRGCYLRNTEPVRQLAELLQRFDLARAITPFRRCMHCNAVLRPIPKETISDRLLPQTRQHFNEFYNCPQCGRIYWKGSHYRRMRRLIESVTGSN